ncbi:hypothetical protein CYL16_03295 [Mycobacterium sp. EPG1]|nr:hypothetical protein CYL16_03295 [Mycobacterium sp. EPG1]
MEVRSMTEMDKARAAKDVVGTIKTLATQKGFTLRDGADGTFEVVGTGGESETGLSLSDAVKRMSLGVSVQYDDGEPFLII